MRGAAMDYVGDSRRYNRLPFGFSFANMVGKRLLTEFILLVGCDFA